MTARSLPQQTRGTPLPSGNTFQNFRNIPPFETALAAFQQPNHGKVDTFTKNEAKDAPAHALRVYIQGYTARNPLVTGEDTEQMGLPLRDTTPTPHPTPDVRPYTDAEPAGKGTH
ncbi:MAG: hypothetical protein LBD48_01115, partial [Treponema sp.]|nr:hypothetical protein [Treponema sp.]